PKPVCCRPCCTRFGLSAPPPGTTRMRMPGLPSISMLAMPVACEYQPPPSAPAVHSRLTACCAAALRDSEPAANVVIRNSLRCICPSLSASLPAAVLAPELARREAGMKPDDEVVDVEHRQPGAAADVGRVGRHVGAFEHDRAD